jgi:predicted dehydrogenase
MTVRLGVLAASNIAKTAIFEPLSLVDGIEVVAIGARSLERAQQAATRWGVPKAFGSYDELLACDEVDAIYIGTPAALHRRWAVAALQAGKHVLNEKPFAANTADAQAIADAADGTGLVLMEAIHWRYHPLVAQMQEILDSGLLGTIERVEGHFNVPAVFLPRTDIRWDYELGGGAMMDLGVYPAAWLRWAVDGEPSVVRATAEAPVTRIDGSLTAELVWPSGVTGYIATSMLVSGDRHTASLTVRGSLGTMDVDNPMAAQSGARLSVSTSTGTTEYPVSSDTSYEHQLRMFRDAVADGSEFPTTADEAIKTMQLLDSCYEASGLGVRPTHPE